MMFLTGMVSPFYPSPVSRLPKWGEAQTLSNKASTWKPNTPSPQKRIHHHALFHLEEGQTDEPINRLHLGVGPRSLPSSAGRLFRYHSHQRGWVSALKIINWTARQARQRVDRIPDKWMLGWLPISNRDKRPREAADLHHPDASGNLWIGVCQSDFPTRSCSFYRSRWYLSLTLLIVTW